MIAQIEGISGLAQFGALGVVCGVLLYVCIAQNRRTETAITRLAKAQLLTATGLGQLDGTVKKQAQELLDEINDGGDE